VSACWSCGATADTAAVLLNAPFTVTDGGAYTVVAAGRDSERDARWCSPTPMTIAPNRQRAGADRAPVAERRRGGRLPHDDHARRSRRPRPPSRALPYQSAARYLRVPNGRLSIRVTPGGLQDGGGRRHHERLAAGRSDGARARPVGGGAPPRVVTLTDR
jgi:hypothetical protein